MEKDLVNELENIAAFNPETVTDKTFQMGYSMGEMSGRAQAITTVINLLKENPNIDGLEILKKL